MQHCSAGSIWAFIDIHGEIVGTKNVPNRVAVLILAGHIMDQGALHARLACNLQCHATQVNRTLPMQGRLWVDPMANHKLVKDCQANFISHVNCPTDMRFLSGWWSTGDWFGVVFERLPNPTPLVHKA